MQHPRRCGGAELIPTCQTSLRSRSILLAYLMPYQKWLTNEKSRERRKKERGGRVEGERGTKRWEVARISGCSCQCSAIQESHSQSLHVSMVLFAYLQFVTKTRNQNLEFRNIREILKFQTRILSVAHHPRDSDVERGSKLPTPFSI